MFYHLGLKKLFLGLCYLLLLFSPPVKNIDPILTNHLSSSQFIVSSEILKSDIFLDPKINKGFQQEVCKISHAYRMFFNFFLEKKFAETLKNYPHNNVDLDFNLPFICYKFPRSEDTKEG